MGYIISHSTNALDKTSQADMTGYRVKSSSRTYRLIIYCGILIVLSVTALLFYSLFKPSDVILNRLLSHVISISPIMTEHNNIIVDTFIQTFGDFISVIMTSMMLIIIIHVLSFPLHEAKQLFRWIIVPFILFECLQIIGFGNFYIRDLFAYALGYQLSFIIINRVEQTAFKSLFDIAFDYLTGKRKDKTYG